MTTNKLTNERLSEIIKNMQDYVKRDSLLSEFVAGCAAVGRVDPTFIDCVSALAELQEYRKAATANFKLPPLNDALIEILGRPNFACIDIAGLLRRDGAEIQRKAEHEQAAVIHFLLNMYLQHENGWIDAAQAELKRIKTALAAGEIK